MFRTLAKAIATLTFLSMASIAFAQQSAVRADQDAMSAGSMSAPAGASAVLAAGDNIVTSSKTVAVALRELSPWSMFLSADVLVKAVIIALGFASLVTWTILIAKTIELWTVQRRLRAALAKIADSRSLAEAQFALDSNDTVLSSLLAAA